MRKSFAVCCRTESLPVSRRPFQRSKFPAQSRAHGAGTSTVSSLGMRWAGRPAGSVQTFHHIDERVSVRYLLCVPFGLVHTPPKRTGLTVKLDKWGFECNCKCHRCEDARDSLPVASHGRAAQLNIQPSSSAPFKQSIQSESGSFLQHNRLHAMLRSDFPTLRTLQRITESIREMVTLFGWQSFFC